MYVKLFIESSDRTEKKRTVDFIMFYALLVDTLSCPYAFGVVPCKNQGCNDDAYDYCRCRLCGITVTTVTNTITSTSDCGNLVNVFCKEIKRVLRFL